MWSIYYSGTLQGYVDGHCGINLCDLCRLRELRWWGTYPCESCLNLKTGEICFVRNTPFNRDNVHCGKHQRIISTIIRCVFAYVPHFYINVNWREILKMNQMLVIFKLHHCKERCLIFAKRLPICWGHDVLIYACTDLYVYTMDSWWKCSQIIKKRK